MARQREKAKTNKPTRLTVDIWPGPVSPARQSAWRKFWQKLIAEVKASER